MEVGVHVIFINLGKESISPLYKIPQNLGVSFIQRSTVLLSQYISQYIYVEYI